MAYYPAYHVLGQHWLHVELTASDTASVSTGLSYSQCTRYTDPMLVQCWASVEDDGPTLNQHWVSVLCLLSWINCIHFYVQRGFDLQVLSMF